MYYFCGSQGRYCSCDLRWNLAGWYKAAVLWNFVLTSSLAVQKLVIQEGLKGLLPGQDDTGCCCNSGTPILPSAIRSKDRAHSWHLARAGEELVTKESFISICWRLIPYWLNNWEQQWGAECSSMMFELPHFAVELLVVLPLVQVSFATQTHSITGL